MVSRGIKEDKKLKLKHITFIFENCDSITIEGKYIGDFLIDDLETFIHRTACNSIERVDAANTVAIEIHKDANKERYAFGQDNTDDLKQMTFDRFKEYADITAVQFELEENYIEDEKAARTEHYDYYVDWVGESDYENEAQKTYLSKTGNLYIVIANEKRLDDFFDLEEVDDERHMDFHFDMYDVGDEYSNPNRYKNKESIKKEN